MRYRFTSHSSRKVRANVCILRDQDRVHVSDEMLVSLLTEMPKNFSQNGCLHIQAKYNDYMHVKLSVPLSSEALRYHANICKSGQ